MEAGNAIGLRGESQIHERPDNGMARKPVVIRGGSGLGDSLYVYSVARWLIEQGESVEVCTFFPEIFSQLEGVKVSDFRRQNVNRIAHYVQRKKKKDTDIFEDVCISAGIPRETELRFDWKPVNTQLYRQVRDANGPRIAILLPRWPMARADGFGRELLPNCEAMQKAVYALRRKGAFTVQVGSGDALFHFRGISLDLANSTSVTDLLDVAAAVDGFFGYCSFFVPLAESLQKPALFMWSRAGLQSNKEFISTVTLKKILHAETSNAVMDDCDDVQLYKATHALYQQARGRAAL